MTTRPVSEIIKQMRESLRETNSELATFPEQGTLYSIFRSVALQVQEQDAKLDSINDSLFLNTADGEALDNKAAEFNITRNNGTPSTGNIIILGNISSIPVDTVLSDSSTGLQFTTIERITITGGRGVGTVECTEFTPLGNLQAGTELFSSVYPNVRFIVGTTFDPLVSSYIGPLFGGSYRETDEELRTRILATISTIGLSTIEALEINAINQPGISKAVVLENVPALGYITIYVNNNDNSVIKRVTRELNRLKPVGTALLIKTFTSVVVNVDLIVTTYNRANQSLLNLSIQESLSKYISDISLNNELTVEGVAAAVFTVDGVVNVKVVNPISAISINSNELLTLGNVNITYN